MVAWGTYIGFQQEYRSTADAHIYSIQTHAYPVSRARPQASVPRLSYEGLTNSTNYDDEKSRCSTDVRDISGSKICVLHRRFRLG
jgi:hypothetical protein